MSDPRPAPVTSRPFAGGARALADLAFARSAGAPLVSGNRIRLLRDAEENFPLWLEAIRSARQRVHFENYILADDELGRRFADAFIERAQAGVPVRVIYDWLGAFRKTSRAYWARLREGGVDVRCFNPPRLESPFGWVSRDHRKLLVVDGEVGFVSGLCVAQRWYGDPARKVAPWRDTGVEIRGPALADLENAFSRIWSLLGPPLPASTRLVRDDIPSAGDVNLRVVASEPSTSGTFRLDQLVVAFARERVWLTDAYYVGSPTYVQALMTSARDGVDVRMLLPRATDIPLLKVMSRVGYRPLLEAGVRIFEWNGSLLHAKTAVVDGRWARVGSTNLNLASWMGNCELDAVVEDAGFAQEMEAMYLDDLGRATEVVLEEGAAADPDGAGRGPRLRTGAQRQRRPGRRRRGAHRQRARRRPDQPAGHRAGRAAAAFLDRPAAAAARRVVRAVPARPGLSGRRAARLDRARAVAPELAAAPPGPAAATAAADALKPSRRGTARGRSRSDLI